MAAAASSIKAGPAAGREARCPSRDRPIDLVHLTRQTLGDRTLEREVLGLMRRQIGVFSDKLDLVDDIERSRIAHALKGAARNVGAFPLADAAEALEAAPANAAARVAMESEMARAAAFIVTLEH